MEYRELGRTGLRVSEIGLGCEGFVGKTEEETQALMTQAVEAGVNCMDLYTPDPDLRSRVGRALRGRREQFVLQAHLCTVWQNGQYKATRDIGEVRASFEDMLRRLETDYIDVGMIHYVDTMDTWNTVANGEVMRYALEQKRAGRIRCIGLSSHNPEVALAAVESGLVEVLMFSVNPCYDLQPGTRELTELYSNDNYTSPMVNFDPSRVALYETCQRLGVGITVMKAFGGGDLLSETLSPAGKALTPIQCLHYALTRPGVATVLAGARSVEELRGSIAYESASEEEKDYAATFSTFPNISWEGHCMYCGHCAPCPRSIDVAMVNKFLNLAKAQGTVPETVREHYEVLAHHAGECIACGACEKRCPFGVPVIQSMQEAKVLFGK